MFEKLLTCIERYLVPVLTGIFVLRVAYLFINGLDLIGDESYYWDWSRRPDWCYYSKPPMVAWLIAIFTGLGGDYTAVVRLPAVVLGMVCLGYLYATAKAFYSSQAAALALLLILAMPFNVLANFVMTIDPPLYCFWMMSLYYLHGALFGQDKNQRLRSWFWAGVATAAAMLSKQVALLIPVMLVCFLLLDQRRRPLFKREFLLYLLPVLLSLVPIVLWNQQHDWVMFSHSKGHFGIKEAVALSTRLEQAGAFLLYQLLLASPVIFVLILVMAYQAGRRFTRLSAEEQLLMLMGPVLLIGILVLSLVQKVQGNWSMPFYFSALILLSGRWLAGERKNALKIGVVMGYLMVMLTYALPVTIQTFNLHNTPVDPTFRFRHWGELAASIETVREKTVPDTEGTLLIALGHRFLASQLAFYLPGHPRVYRYEGSGQIVSQYEVWGGPEDAIGKNAFIVAEQTVAELPAPLTSVFVHFYEVGTVVNPMDKRKSYHLFLGEHLKVWPTAQQAPLGGG
ncbi:MAG: glycosyltransferase family 39 protein [Methylovulum sp.]|nr:glycosyltransferase family 39 protein [Methylovulum sp.]